MRMLMKGSTMAGFNIFGKKKKKVHKKLPKTVQDSLPYRTVFKDGTIETDPGVYTRAYSLTDINFKIADDATQVAIFRAYGDFLNSFPKDVMFQIVVQNHTADKRDTFESVRFQPQRDGLNKYRQEMNNILLEKMTAGRKNLQQDKFLVVSIEDDDTASAIKVLNSTEKEIEKSLRKISKSAVAVRQTARERLHTLFSIYNQDGRSVFYNDLDENGNPVFTFDTINQAGLTTKDIIGPSDMEFKANYFTLGDTYGCAMHLAGVPNWLSTEFISDLSDTPCNLLISIYHTPIETSKAMRMIKDHLMAVNGQIAVNQKRAIREGYTADLVAPDLALSQQQTRDLIDQVLENDQKLYYLTFCVTVFGDSKEALENNKKMIEAVSTKYLCPIKTLGFQQEQGLNTSLPLCLKQVEIKRLYTTQSASVFIPYTSMELYQRKGIYYGTNKMSDNMIMYSRSSGNNANGLIFGESGSGKSFAAKNEMLSVLLRNANNRVFVIDPEEEYVKMARALGGEVVDLAPGSQTYVNPLDMDLDYDGESDPVGMKAEYIVSMVEIMLSGGRTIDPQAKSVLTRCVHAIYRPYLEHLKKRRKNGEDITCDKEAMPTLNNLYNELLRQDEPEAQTLARIIEMYATGSFATFAHRSNVETNAPFVVYNIKNLGSGMKDLGLHVCLNDIWNKMIENRKKDLWTWIYIDEFYLLLQSDSAAKFLMMVWKRARKWRGVPTGIMQNTEDLLRSSDSRNIINNTSFIMMMSLPKLDRTNLSDLLQLSEQQLEYITNAQPGNGLLWTNKTVLPFKNEFPEDTALYRIMDTSH